MYVCACEDVCVCMYAYVCVNASMCVCALGLDNQPVFTFI